MGEKEKGCLKDITGKSNIVNLNWRRIPKEIRCELINEVYCGHCDDCVKIIIYYIEENKYELILQGKCSICGKYLEKTIEK
ncbi:hypothetical protein [Anaeromicrobium sediminis]|uniref:Uncharacterized protein n=1 Tax=Anaeromicrobium sediminis TaxID=1478221 RepID=A0A267MM56_9FIRM|nr:hypothetical protein [Anaeromicrobium sediminis]PAB60691.1 hypothetical protein CCE28_03900 [Anaeromicrobium sediminis]